MILIRLPLGALLALCAVLSPALAQMTVTTRATATTGKTVRLVVAPSLKRDCSAGPLPEIRVTSAPKNGSLITRSAKLKTPASYRCPNKDTEVQAVYYQSNARYTGSDEAVFEVKTSDGIVEKRTVQITVGGSPAGGAPAKETTDL